MHNQPTQAPQDPQPFPTVTALLIAIILSLSRWVDWLLRNTVPIVTSPRFTNAVKDAGLAAAPVMQKVVGDVWNWYTATERDKPTSSVSATGAIVPCKTSQSLTFGISMPGVTFNMQYQANSAPVVQSAGKTESAEPRLRPTLEEDRLQLESGQQRRVLFAPPSEAAPPPSTLFSKARDSVASVSNLPLHTLAYLPYFTPLHPVRMCTSVWNASRPAKPNALR
jgi:hypothetical protein